MTIVAWLESTEGRQWSKLRGEPNFLLASFGDVYPLNDFSVGLGEANWGVHDPRHDPCGRGPLCEVPQP